MSRRARLLRCYRRILRFIERNEAVLRRPLKLFRQLHDREFILGVRGIAKREGIEMPDAWRKVISAGITALKGKQR